MGRESRLRMVGRDAGIPILGAAKAPTVAVGYAYGTLHGPFVESLQRLREYEITKMSQGGEVLMRHRIPEQGLYIEDNRMRIAEKFLASGAEWLLQIDTDIEFPHTIIESLLAVAGSDKKVLAASVPLGHPLPSCAWNKTDVPGVWAALAPEEIKPEGVAVDGLATAVMLVHREVFEAIARREGRAWFYRLRVPKLDEPRSREAWSRSWAGEKSEAVQADLAWINQGEDYSFCIRAADAGYQIWCCRLPGLRHYKTEPKSHDFDLVEEAAPLAAVEA